MEHCKKSRACKLHSPSFNNSLISTPKKIMFTVIEHCPWNTISQSIIAEHNFTNDHGTWSGVNHQFTTQSMQNHSELVSRTISLIGCRSYFVHLYINRRELYELCHRCFQRFLLSHRGANLCDFLLRLWVISRRRILYLDVPLSICVVVEGFANNPVSRVSRIHQKALAHVSTAHDIIYPLLHLGRE